MKVDLRSISSEKPCVCISTFYGTSNHGTNLQSVALAKYFEQLNYQVYFLDDFKVGSMFLKYPALFMARVRNVLLKKQASKFFTPVKYELTEERKKRIRRFREDNYKSISFLSSADIDKAGELNMLFVTGSDIIWNPARGYPTRFFVDFAYYAGFQRFSYASSVGAKELPRQFHRAYRRYLGSMIAVSVREQSIADKMSEIIGRPVEKVVDPTLLLTAEDWDHFASKADFSIRLEKKYIFCYFVMNDSRYWEYVRKIKEKTGLQIVVLPMHEIDEQQPYDVISDGTVYEFVSLIRNAEFICTDSFHACVFSIIYNKEFYLLRRSRASEDEKFEDLLHRYELADRIIKDESDFERSEVTGYDFVNSQLKADRDKSKEFIKKALRKAEVQDG